MQRNVLDYRVVIEKEDMDGKTVYNAFCPTLGLSDYGNSIDQAIDRIRKLMKFHIESLAEFGQDISCGKKLFDGCYQR